MQYKYSIIIPHYNDERRLKRLLSSIPLERIDIQTIVIDDCSTNKNLLNNVKEKFPNVLWLSTNKNSGSGKARNIGLESACGKYLIFADSDDEFINNAFDIIDNTPERKLGDLCYFLSEAVLEDDLSISNRAITYNQLCLSYIENKNTYNLINLKMRHVVPWAKVYKKSSIKALNIKFDEVFVSNDIAFNVIAAFELKNINVNPKTIYRVYRRPGSLTSKKGKDNLLARLNTLASLGTRLREKGIHHKPLATSYLIRSIKYGPKFFIETFLKIIKSDLALFDIKHLNPKFIYKSLCKIRQTKKENSRVS